MSNKSTPSKVLENNCKSGMNIFHAKIVSFKASHYEEQQIKGSNNYIKKTQSRNEL